MLPTLIHAKCATNVMQTIPWTHFPAITNFSLSFLIRSMLQMGAFDLHMY